MSNYTLWPRMSNAIRELALGVALALPLGALIVSYDFLAGVI